MRIPIVIIIAILLWACQGNLPLSQNYEPLENSKALSTELVDSLGSVSYLIPNRYDTFFHWTNQSDCGKPCEKEVYRSQSKAFSISKESGFIYLNTPKDSIDQFTISHSGWFPFHDVTDSSFIAKLHQHRKADMINSPETYRIKFDTIEKINDRNFSIIVVDLYDTTNSIFSKKVIGTTTIKGNGIEFKYELLTRKNDSINKSFIGNSLRLLKAIKITNGI